MKSRLIAVLSISVLPLGCAGPAFTESRSSTSETGGANHGSARGGNAGVDSSTNGGLGSGGTEAQSSSAAPTNSCEYGDTTYAVGDSIPMADETCGSCTFTANGIDCSNDVCDGSCRYEGVTLQANETRTLADRCTACTCGAFGHTSCNSDACALTCTRDGTTYNVGDVLPVTDSCTQCTCTPSGLDCPQLECCTRGAYVVYDPPGVDCSDPQSACPIMTTRIDTACGCACVQDRRCIPKVICQGSVEYQGFGGASNANTSSSSASGGVGGEGGGGSGSGGSSAAGGTTATTETEAAGGSGGASSGTSDAAGGAPQSSTTTAVDSLCAPYMRRFCPLTEFVDI